MTWHLPLVSINGAHIDPVIKKTLVVGAKAGIVTAGYVAVVVGVGNLIGISASPNLVLSPGRHRHHRRGLRARPPPGAGLGRPPRLRPPGHAV